jgi:hypothetical protein
LTGKTGNKLFAGYGGNNKGIVIGLDNSYLAETVSDTGFILLGKKHKLKLKIVDNNIEFWFNNELVDKGDNDKLINNTWNELQLVVNGYKVIFHTIKVRGI